MSKKQYYGAICSNCNKEFTAVIEKGHDVNSGRIRWTCPHCNTVVRASKEFIDYVNKRNEERAKRAIRS